MIYKLGLLFNKVLSVNDFHLIKPDPDYARKPNFKFDIEFFTKHFKSGKLSIQIESKLDGRHSVETFNTWQTKVVKQLKKAGINYFANKNLEQFNIHHERYVQERVDVKNSQIEGKGAFAKQDIKRGDFLGFYTGHYKKDLADGSLDEQAYYFDLPVDYGGEYVVSGAPGDGGNALCRANDVTTHGQFPVKTEPGLEANKVNIVALSVKVNGMPFIGYFAKRDIEKGNELFISYGKSYWQNLKENQDVEYVECHITKIIPAGFEEIFNVDSGQIELGEISSNDIEPDLKRRRIDTSAQQVIWVDLEGSDDLSGESETDDGLAGSSSTHKSLYDRYKVEGINIDLTTFLKRLNSQIKSFIDLYELPVVEMLDLKQNSFITQDMQQAFFTCIATHTFFKEATYLYEDEIETKTSQLERVCAHYEESKIGTENAGVTCWANASLVFLRGVQLCGKSLPGYLESIILDEGAPDSIPLDGNDYFELNNEEKYGQYRRETINKWKDLLSNEIQDPEARKDLLLEIIECFNRIINPVTPLAYNIQNDPTEFIQQAFVDAFIPESDQFIDSGTRKIRDELKGAIAVFGGDIITTTRTGLNANEERYEISKPKEEIVWLGLSPRNLEQGNLNRTIKRQVDGDIEPLNPEADKDFQVVGQEEIIEFRSNTIYAKRTAAEYDPETQTLTTKKIDTPMPIPEGKEATDLKRAIIHLGRSMNGGHYISVVKASDGNYYEINDAMQRKINDIAAYWDQNKGNILLADFGNTPNIEVPDPVIHMETSEDEAGSTGSSETGGSTKIGSSSRESSPSDQLTVTKNTPNIEVLEPASQMDVSVDAANLLSFSTADESSSSRERIPGDQLTVTKKSWGDLSRDWVANPHPTPVKEHFFLKGMPKIDESIIEKTRPYLEPLLSRGVISNEQADAVIALIACNERGSMSLLGDEPGLGKTRTLMVYLLIQHNLTAGEGNLLFVAPNDRILEGQESDRQIVLDAFRHINIFGKGLKVPEIRKLYNARDSRQARLMINAVDKNILFLQTTKRLEAQIADLKDIKVVVVDEVHTASKKTGDEDTLLSKCIKKVTDGSVCRAVFASATSITHANSELFSLWGEESEKKVSNVEAQAKITRLYEEGKLVVRGLELQVNLEVGSLKRVVAENPLDMLAEAASDAQKELTAIQEEISRVRRVYTILNKNDYKNINIRLSTYLKRLVEEEKLITLILNINKEEDIKRHVIYVEGVGNFSKTVNEICKGCYSLLTDQDSSLSEADRNLLNELIGNVQRHEGEPPTKKARLEQTSGSIGAYLLKDPSKLLEKYLDSGKYTAIGSSEIQQKPRRKVERKGGPPPAKRQRTYHFDGDVLFISGSDDHNSELASNAESSWDTTSNAVMMLSVKTSTGINLHGPLKSVKPEDVVLDIVGIPNKGETWEQLIGRFRRTGIDESKLEVKVWHLDADPIPDHKSMMNVVEKLDKQTIFSKGGLSTPWISNLLGRCHVWSSLNSHKQDIQDTFKVSLSRLGLSEFQDVSKFLLDLELHENQEQARKLVSEIESFLCKKENILEVKAITDVPKKEGVEELVTFRNLELQSGMESAVESLFAIKTYDRRLDHFIQKIIIPFYGFEEKWIRFENSVMPFWVVMGTGKENILKLFQESHELIASFLKLGVKEQGKIIRSMLKKNSQRVSQRVSQPNSQQESQQLIGHPLQGNVNNPKMNKEVTGVSTARSRIGLVNEEFDCNDSTPPNSQLHKKPVKKVQKKGDPKSVIRIVTEHEQGDYVRDSKVLISNLAEKIHKAGIKDNDFVNSLLKSQKQKSKKQKKVKVSSSKSKQKEILTINPFIQACRDGDLEIVKSIVQTNPGLINEEGCVKVDDGATCLSFPLLTAAGKGHNDIVTYLLQNNAKINQKRSSYGETPLFFAAAHGQKEIVEKLLEAGAEKDLKDADGSTALMIAAEEGHLEIVNKLLEAGANKDLQSKIGWTALMFAAEKGHLEIVNKLLEVGANKDLKHDTGWTALMFATQKGHVEIVEKLLEAGADKDLKNDTGWTALMFAAQKGHKEIVEKLLEAGSDKGLQNKHGCTPLMIAAINGQVEIVEKLLKAGANKDLQSKDGRRALMLAVEKGHLEIVKLLQNHSDNRSPATLALPVVDRQAKYGCTYLMLAAEKGHVEIVNKLLKAGANKDLQSKDGRTALMLAAQKVHVEIVEKLLEAGAGKDLQSQLGYTALMLAAEKGHVEIVEQLIKAGADKDLKSIHGWTALIFATQKGHVEIVEKLLKAGADKDLKNDTGWTALMFAAEKGHVEIVEKLLDAGADKDIQDKGAWTALMLAAQKGHKAIVEKLLEAGADKDLKNDTGWTALMLAAQKGHKAIVDKLLKAEANKDIQNNFGWTALMIAAQYGHLEIVELLLKAVAAKDLKQDTGWTALMLAVEKGHLDIVEKLLNAGADKDFQSKDGRTALMLAVQNGHKEIVGQLLEAGADKDLQNEIGSTALLMATEKGHSEIEDLFHKENRKVNLDYSEDEFDLSLFNVFSDSTNLVERASVKRSSTMMPSIWARGLDGINAELAVGPPFSNTNSFSNRRCPNKQEAFEKWQREQSEE